MARRGPLGKEIATTGLGLVVFALGSWKFLTVVARLRWWLERLVIGSMIAFDDDDGWYRSRREVYEDLHCEET
jgi:hypothetical protein